MQVNDNTVDTRNVVEIESNKWLADSCASGHICNNIRMLWNVKKMGVRVIVKLFFGEVIVTTCAMVKMWGYGDIAMLSMALIQILRGGALDL